jgi:hypothetical protein
VTLAIDVDEPKGAAATRAKHALALRREGSSLRLGSASPAALGRSMRTLGGRQATLGKSTR